MAACPKFCQDSHSKSPHEFLFQRDSLQDPAKNLPLSENLGEIQGRILARFWPLRFLLPGGILVRFAAGSQEILATENFLSVPVRNLAGSPLGIKITAAKILPANRGDSPHVLCRILPRSQSLFYKDRQVASQQNRHNKSKIRLVQDKKNL